MGLRCLIVTRDSNLLGLIKAQLSEHEATFDLRQDSESAIELASRRHWDGIVIDCDEVPGSKEAVAQVRKSRSNKQTLILAVLNGSTSVNSALDQGATFALSKPIEEIRLRSIIEAAVPTMEREHRRYFRYDADVTVRLRNHRGQTITARMMNVSQGGLAITVIDPLSFEGIVAVEFEIPSIEPRSFRGKADVVWADSLMMGLRFLHTDKHSDAALDSWLTSLQAQLRFHESSPGTS